MAGLFGWVLKAIWNTLKELKTEDHILNEKVNRIEVLIAGQYVTREEFNKTVSRMFEKLDNIADILNRQDTQG